ncbi:hypothetical protein JTE90_015630 [Oedothorax gibbosus]|uniref:Uncharacterized protein n=1 Tax=Oedothorax gibbosus TaxID=931172 RepID=A0AAV6TFF6_9ARAC|nr:hypothetical protein JTE90_015630 [Oedothorax gibbosus]
MGPRATLEGNFGGNQFTRGSLALPARPNLNDRFARQTPKRTSTKVSSGPPPGPAYFTIFRPNVLRSNSATSTSGTRGVFPFRAPPARGTGIPNAGPTPAGALFFHFPRRGYFKTH